MTQIFYRDDFSNKTALTWDAFLQELERAGLISLPSSNAGDYPERVEVKIVSAKIED